MDHRPPGKPHAGDIRRFVCLAGDSSDSFPAKAFISMRFRASSFVDRGSMASTASWFRYLKTKLNFSLFLVAKTAERGEIQHGEMGRTFWKNLLQGKMSFLHWIKGEEMSPTIAAAGGTLLVRKIPDVGPLNVFIGDVEDPSNLLVRRLAAVEGHEMVSADDEDEPFVLGRG